MEMMQGIYGRRSVRQYAETPVARETIEQLLDAAVQAPSAMNSQPWAFGIILGKETIRGYSDRSKAYLLSTLDSRPMLERYRRMLSNPESNLFYDASAAILIYAKPQGPQPERDCCLAAQNMMLAAYGLGLGTCWIGLAQMFLNQPEAKAELGVPAEYTIVAPLALGYPSMVMPKIEKKAPEILFWNG